MNPIETTELAVAVHTLSSQLKLKTYSPCCVFFLILALLHANNDLALSGKIFEKLKLKVLDMTDVHKMEALAVTFLKIHNFTLKTLIVTNLARKLEDPLTDPIIESLQQAGVIVINEPDKTKRNDAITEALAPDFKNPFQELETSLGAEISVAACLKFSDTWSAPLHQRTVGYFMGSIQQQVWFLAEHTVFPFIGNNGFETLFLENNQYAVRKQLSGGGYAYFYLQETPLDHHLIETLNWGHNYSPEITQVVFRVPELRSKGHLEDLLPSLANLGCKYLSVEVQKAASSQIDLNLTENGISFTATATVQGSRSSIARKARNFQTLEINFNKPFTLTIIVGRVCVLIANIDKDSVIPLTKKDKFRFDNSEFLTRNPTFALWRNEQKGRPNEFRIIFRLNNISLFIQNSINYGFTYAIDENAFYMIINDSLSIKILVDINWEELLQAGDLENAAPNHSVIIPFLAKRFLRHLIQFALPPYSDQTELKKLKFLIKDIDVSKTLMDVCGCMTIADLKGEEQKKLSKSLTELPLLSREEVLPIINPGFSPFPFLNPQEGAPTEEEQEFMQIERGFAYFLNIYNLVHEPTNHKITNPKDNESTNFQFFAVLLDCLPGSMIQALALLELHLNRGIVDPNSAIFFKPLISIEDSDQPSNLESDLNPDYFPPIPPDLKSAILKLLEFYGIKFSNKTNYFYTTNDDGITFPVYFKFHSFKNCLGRNNPGYCELWLRIYLQTFNQKNKRWLFEPPAFSPIPRENMEKLRAEFPHNLEDVKNWLEFNSLFLDDQWADTFIKLFIYYRFTITSTHSISIPYIPAENSFSYRKKYSYPKDLEQEMREDLAEYYSNINEIPCLF